MKQIFLLKLIADFLKSDKPTVEEIRCARTILDNLIKNDEEPEIETTQLSDLDSEAQQAQKELM